MKREKNHGRGISHTLAILPTTEDEGVSHHTIECYRKVIRVRVCLHWEQSHACSCVQLQFHLLTLNFLGNLFSSIYTASFRSGADSI